MPISIAAAIDREIASLEARLGKLRTARKVLGVDRVNGSAPTSPRRKRRRLTAGEKAAISKRMKEAWKRRKASKAA